MTPMLPDPSRSRAVLIGASRFTDPELPDLPAVRANLDALAACLCDPGLWGLPRAHCAVVADPDSGVALVDAVHDAAAEAEDTLVIYYAGHGLVHPRTLALLLAVPGSRPGRPHTAVPYDQLRDYVVDSPAARRVVILDCCYSGRAIGGMADPASAVADEASAEGTYLLASAPPNKQALSPPGETYTAFTGALLSVLTEGVPDGPELLPLNAIYRHVRDTLRRAARPEPQLRVDNTAGELALVRNRQRAAQVQQPVVVAPDFHDRYDLGRIIESRGKVAVHYAIYPVLGNRRVMVALVAKPDNPAEFKRIVDTIDKVAAIHHPAILSIRGASEYTSHQFCVPTDDFDGPNLLDVLESGGPMDPAHAVRIMSFVCSALDHWHQRGLVHGDLRAVNVVFHETVPAKTVNFGIGEYVMPHRNVSAATDVYAAGRLLYEMITGTKPGAGAPAPSELRPGISTGLDRVVRRALAPRSHERYKTAADLNAELMAVGGRKLLW